MAKKKKLSFILKKNTKVIDMKQKGIFEGAKYAFHKHVAPMGICIGILILLAAGVSMASATTITVNPGGSIQAAIDSLPAEGGVVELAAGTHVLSQGGTIEIPIHKNQNIAYTHPEEVIQLPNLPDPYLPVQFPALPESCSIEKLVIQR